MRQRKRDASEGKLTPESRGLLLMWGGFLVLILLKIDSAVKDVFMSLSAILLYRFSSKKKKRG